MPTPLTPCRLRTLAAFAAPDPWQGNHPEEWTLETCLLLPPNRALPRYGRPRPAPSPGTLRSGETLVVRSETDGKRHVLPNALQELWLQKRLRTEDLPWLVHQIEPTTKRFDYGGRALLRTLRILAGILLVAALAFVMIYLFSEAGSEHKFRNMTPQEWLSSPWVYGQAVNVTGIVPVSSIDAPPFPLRVPSGVRGYAGTSSGNVSHPLGLITAAHEHRLVLLNAPDVITTALFGISLHPEEIGLSASAMEALRARAPDLNTRLIFCNYWSWPDSYGDGAALGKLWLWMAGFYCAIALILLWLAWARQQRYRSQQGAALRRLEARNVLS